MRTCVRIIGLAGATAMAALTFAGPASAQTVPSAQQAGMPRCAVESPSGLLGVNLPILSNSTVGRCV